MQIKDGITLMQQQQRELLLDISKANRWGVVAVLSKAMLIPLHVCVNAFELTAAQKMFQHVADDTVLAVRLGYGEHEHGIIQPALKIMKTAAKKELERRQLVEYLPGVDVLFGLAEDSASLLQTALQVSKGDSEMSEEDRAIARTIEHTMQRATAALRELQAREARLRRLAPGSFPAARARSLPLRLL
jgi:hypothetical protein